MRTVGVDIETQDDQIWCVGVADGEGRTAFNSVDAALEYIGDRTPIFHNAGFDLSYLDPNGTIWGREFRDTLTQAHIKGCAPKNLPDLTATFLTGEPLDKTFVKERHTVRFEERPEETLEGCSKDAWATWALNAKWGAEMAQYEDIMAKERVTCRVLMDMKRRGMPVSQRKLKLARQSTLLHMADIEEAFTKIGIDPANRDDFGEWFWKGKTNLQTTTTGKLTTSADVLREHMTEEQEELTEKFIEWHQLDKYNCLAPWTRILTEDLRWVRLDSLNVGDVLIGIDEDRPSKNQYRKLRPTVIEGIRRVFKPSYRIEFSDGHKVIASSEHPWLVRYESGQWHRNVGTYHWSTTKDIRLGAIVCKLSGVWDEDESKDAGYLAGFADADGSVRPHGVDLTQNSGPTAEYVKRLLDKLGFSYFVGHHDKIEHIGIRTQPEHLRFLGQVRPQRLLAKSKVVWEGFAVNNPGPSTTVVGVEYIGVQPLVGLQTSTKTFIAEGYVTHNSTYLDAWAGQEFIHANLNQTGTASWRYSCSKPNLQNVPKKGSKIVPLYQLFEAPEGYVFISADYSQIELRALAVLTQDQNLLNVYRRDGDLHSETVEALAAQGVFEKRGPEYVLREGLSEKEIAHILDTQRRFGKTLNFGIPYGMGGRTYAARTGMTKMVTRNRWGKPTPPHLEPDAQAGDEFIEAWFGRFPGVREWQAEVQAHGEEHGYVLSSDGRPLWVHGMRAEYAQIRHHAEKQCGNFPIQFHATEIMKEASRRCPDYLVMSVHDELLYMVPQEIAQEYHDYLSEALIDRRDEIPYTIDIHMGKSWGDIKNIEDIWVDGDGDDEV